MKKAPKNMSPMDFVARLAALLSFVNAAGTAHHGSATVAMNNHSFWSISLMI